MFFFFPRTGGGLFASKPLRVLYSPLGCLCSATQRLSKSYRNVPEDIKGDNKHITSTAVNTHGNIRTWHIQAYNVREKKRESRPRKYFFFIIADIVVCKIFSCIKLLHHIYDKCVLKKATAMLSWTFRAQNRSHWQARLCFPPGYKLRMQMQTRPAGLKWSLHTGQQDPEQLHRSTYT